MATQSLSTYAILKTCDRIIYKKVRNGSGHMENVDSITNTVNKAMNPDGAYKQVENVVDSLSDAIMVVDRNKIVRIWNRAIEKMTGVSKEDIIGKDYHLCGTPVLGASGSFLLDLLEDYDEELAAKYPCSTEDGAVIHAEVSEPALYAGKGAHLMVHASMIFDSECNKVGALQSIRDITQLKLANEAVLESEQKFRGISFSAKDAIIVLNGAGEIVYWNPAAEELFGYTALEALGKDAHMLFAPEMTHEGCEKSAVEFTLTHSESVVRQTIELTAIRKDGTECPIELSVSPFTLNGMGHAIAIVRDITRHKRVEESLMKARYEAEDANKAKSEFLANMSHEFRTPLNAINGFSELMLDGLAGELSEPQREYLNHIQLSGQHLLSLINDILDLSKVEAGLMELDLNQIIVSDLLKSTLNLAREKILKRKLKITLEMDEDVGTMIADVRLIKQALFNLLSNAVKFTPDGGSIALKVRKADDDFIEFSVTDTGIGIAIENQEKLFQPFKQLDSSYNKKFAGTGLGLSLCSKIVALHGGRIWLQSTEGEGSTFSFSIPLLSEMKGRQH